MRTPIKAKGQFFIRRWYKSPIFAKIEPNGKIQGDLHVKISF
jgi:hypothetical protein